MGKEKKKCQAETLVYSRITGYYESTRQYNPGKKEEFKDRKTYKLKKDNFDDGKIHEGDL